MPSIFRVPLFLIFAFIFLAPNSYGDANSCAQDTINLLVGNHHLLHHELAESARFTEDGKVLSVVLSTDEFSHNLLAITSPTSLGRFKTIDPFSGKAYAGVEIKISEDGRYATFTPPAKFKSQPFLYDVQLDVMHPLKGFSQIAKLEFSGNGKFVYSKVSGDQLGIYNIEKKSFQTIEMNKAPWTTVSVGDSHLMVLSKKNLPVLVDLEAGSKVKMELEEAKKLISSEGSLASPQKLKRQVAKLNFDADAEVLEFLLPKGDSAIAQVQFKSHDKFYFGLWDTKTGELKKWEVPFNSVPIFSKTKNKVLFYFPDSDYFKGGSYTIYDLQELSQLTMSGKIPKSNLAAFYKKFEKPGAFKLDKNANEVVHFFEKGLYQKNKLLTQKMLLNVLSESTGMYESLIARYPELASEGFFRSSTLSETNHLWNSAVKKYLDYFSVARTSSESIVKSMDYLRPLKNYFPNLSIDDLNTYADNVVEALADAATKNEFDGVFKSMIYKFSESTIDPMFGVVDRPITDITFVRKPYELKPIVMGTKAIDGKLTTANPYGFFAEHLPTIHISKTAKAGDVVLKDHLIRWTQNGKPYQAKINITVQGPSLESVAPQVNHFHMKKLLKDKKLTGMMVVGSNLAAEDADTIAAYEKYYLKNGFRFENAKQGTQDLKSFMNEKISGGEVDYFIKEAHSDGDERNLMRINNSAIIRKATRNMGDGNQEVIYLVYPTGVPKNYTSPKLTTLISNDDLTQWMQNRAKNGGEDLVYFNTSCWSISKAIGEIENAYTKKLIDISSTTPVNMFENLPSNAEYNILNDFRLGKSVTEMEKDALANPGNAHGTGNTFSFYNSARFRDKVLNNARPALKIKVELTGPDGKVYNIDE